MLVLLQKMVDTESFVTPYGSLQCSREVATGFYSGPFESGPHLHSFFLHDPV